MSQTPRPILKLKVGKSAILASTTKDALPAAPSPARTETPTSAGPKKFKLKLGVKKQPSTEATSQQNQQAQESVQAQPTSTPTKIKLFAKKKPKPESLEAPVKKRDHDAIIDGETPVSAGPKKIRLTTKPKTPGTPYLKLKPKAKPILRPRGLAYDSEASDREDDPSIEEGFILRMTPGEDCEYIRKAIEEKRWGPRSQGGADIRLKFLQADGRRAVLMVRGRIYAASLVDMPCIVEGMKSWDKKAWYKASDICQMLLVLGIVKSEAEALEYPLPGREVDKESHAFAHGLTPPMQWVRKRRFRHRVSTRTIEAVEEEVERLLQVDAEAAEPVKYEVIDMDRLSRAPSERRDSAQPDDDDFMGGEADADGEADMFNEDGYFDVEEEDEDALAAAFEMGMEEEGDMVIEAATPAESSNPGLETQNVTDSEAPTPGAGATSKEDSGDEESDDDDEIDDMDEDAMEQRADLQRAREEIADLEAVIKEQIADMEKLGNPILKKRKAEKIQTLRSDLELKKSAIGEGEDD
jgi:transcription initiation factor TFIID subunit 7